MKLRAGDLTFGLRLLRKDKAYSLATVLTLALCIGANTALFSIVNSVLLRPLRVPEPGRLVSIYNSYPKAGAAQSANSAPDYFDRVAMPAFESVAFFNMPGLTLGEGGHPENVVSGRVTPSFFRVLKAEAQLGRTFTEEEGEVGNDSRVVLSDGLWRERFGADPAIVGRDVRVDGRSFSVVGVMPAGFTFLDSRVRMWVPLAFSPQQRRDEARHNNNWACVARLRDGVTIEQAQAQVDAMNAAVAERVPAFKPILVNAGYHTVVVSLTDHMVRAVRATLYLLWGGTAFVLLIGCVNVINLALVRSHSRLRELATRFALGARRWRVGRQLLAENMILALAGGGLGLLVGWALLVLLRRLNIEQVSRAAEIRLDATATMFTVGLAVLLGLVIGVFPLANFLQTDLTSVLHESGRTGTGGRGARLLRRSLVVAQVGTALVLLIGAGVLTTSFNHVLAVEPGFDAREVLTASVTLPPSRYAGAEEMRKFAGEAVSRIRALPGVKDAGATSFIPLGGDHSDSVILAEGYQMKPGESVIAPARCSVTPGYFEAMRIPLKRGRYFDESDSAESRRVVIVDARLARRFWGDGDPIGRRMYFPSGGKDIMEITENTRWFTVVGVVGDVKLDGLVTAHEPVGAYYFPMQQAPTRLSTFAIRTATGPETQVNALRSVVSGLDPELPVFSVMTMEKRTEESLVNRRWPMLLSVGYAAAALLLSAIGIYGVLAYLVAQRTKEVGIRMALGAAPRAIFELVATEGAALIAAGFVLGAAGAFAVRKSIEAQLYNVRLGDPAVLASAVFVLAAVGLVACLIPARRATRINPVQALNRE